MRFDLRLGRVSRLFQIEVLQQNFASSGLQVGAPVDWSFCSSFREREREEGRRLAAGWAPLPVLSICAFMCMYICRFEYIRST